MLVPEFKPSTRISRPGTLGDAEGIVDIVVGEVRTGDSVEEEEEAER